MNFDRAEPRARHTENNLIPLINVVFLLLIFILLVGTLAPTDPSKIQAPASTATGARSVGSIEVSLAADGQPLLAGQRATLAQLKKALRSILADQQAMGEKTVTQTIEIKADHRAPASSLQAVLTVFQALEVLEVRLITVDRAR